jgi:hypothetical protein
MNHKIKSAWHKYRKFSKKKDADGNTLSSVTPGLGLKAWARTCMKNDAEPKLAESCQVWFKNKSEQ